MDFTNFDTILRLKEMLKNKGFDLTTSGSDERMREDYINYLEDAYREYPQYNMFIAEKEERIMFGVGYTGVLSAISMLNNAMGICKFDYKGNNFAVFAIDINDDSYLCAKTKVNNLNELVDIFK